MSGSGAEVRPVARSTWFTTPWRPRIAIHAYVRIRMLVRNGRITATTSTVPIRPRKLARNQAVGTPSRTQISVTPSAVWKVIPRTFR